MKIDELLVKYVNKDKKEREVGRYWASDLYDIIHNKITLEELFNKQDIELDGARKIVSGIAFEAMLNDIFNKMNVKFDYQKKYEIKIDKDITLVVIPDFEFDNFVLETKYPGKIYDEIPEWYEYQLEAEHRATGKDVYLGIFTHPFDIKTIPFEPSEERWNKIQEALINFNNQKVVK